MLTSVAVRHGVIDTGGGVRLPYVDQGDPAGTPVLFLHGFPDSLYSYSTVLTELPGSVRAVVPSLRGHGDASKPQRGYDPSDFAGDIAVFMQRLAIPEAVLVGHSMGATIAQQFALDYPERTRGLVLIGAFADFASKPDIVELAESTLTMADPIDLGLIREFQASTLAQPVPAALFERLVAESTKVPARAWRGITAGWLASDLLATRTAIAAPTLLVWGSNDAMIPFADQKTILAAMPQARLQVYDGAGHSLQWEEPARFAADLLAFVRQVGEGKI